MDSGPPLASEAVSYARVKWRAAEIEIIDNVRECCAAQVRIIDTHQPRFYSGSQHEQANVESVEITIAVGKCLHQPVQ